MEVRAGSLSFPRARDIGPRIERATFNFTRPVRQAVAALSGTGFGFSPRDDHHLGVVNVRLGTSIDDDVVTVEGTFGVRDWSDEWDDDYEGTIQFILLADLETGFIPSNLSITGVEYNQATQFFRSQLDPATARPDNSISLIAGKNTVLRVFVDTQTDPSRPTIARIVGLLEIRLPGSATWNPLVRLNGPISPLRDSAIRRRNSNDTLNFLLPGAFSSGNVDYRVRVFDPDHQAQPGYISARVQGTLQFTRVAPLRVRGVGVHYTGQGLDIPAPDIAALRSTLSFVQKNYPVGQVFISGFDVIDYDGDFTDMSGDGCGSGWGGLLDRLREMQGDSDDIYYGLIPAAVPRGSGGCGGGDGRVAAGPVGRGPTAAQEIAHAFGRDHAPCPPAGQPDSPDNIDTNYPTYDALPSGSIGEFGIDDSGTVQDSASTSDFMSYCSPWWVSPYTYEALRQNFPSIPASSAHESQQREEHIELPSAPSQYLFLNFRIYRGGKVEMSPSFHYLALPSLKTGRWTPYAIELRDCHNKVLHAQRVWLSDPHNDLDSASISFFKPIPFHEDTARVVFTCGTAGMCEQKELLSVDVPRDAPEVRIVSPCGGEQLAGSISVTWEADFHHQPLTFLLQYSNDAGQTWRTIAPRLRVKEYNVNLDQLPGGEQCQFQVLATEGIRTGVAVSHPFSVAQKGRATVIVAPTPQTVLTRGQAVHLIGESYSADAGSAHPSQLQWTSDIDGPLGVGQELHITSLRPGQHTISLRAPDGYGGESVVSIQIEVETPAPHGHTSLSHPHHTSKDHISGQVPYQPEGGSHDGD